MAMKKTGSAIVTGKTDIVEENANKSGIIKCAVCGQAYLSARGKCPHCVPKKVKEEK